MTRLSRIAAACVALLALPALAIAQNYFSTPFRTIALSTTVIKIKGARGTLSWIRCWNPNASVDYVQVFDVSTPSLVTLGTTAARLSLPMAPTASTPGPDQPVNFLNGISVAATTTSSGLTAPAVGLECSGGFL